MLMIRPAQALDWNNRLVINEGDVVYWRVSTDNAAVPESVTIRPLFGNFAEGPQTITLGEGKPFEQVGFTSLEDTVYEVGETFGFVFDAGPGSGVDVNFYTGDIVNDDSLPTIAIAAQVPTLAENATDPNFKFDVTRTGEDLSMVTTVEVSFAGTGVTPATAADFTSTLAPQYVTFGVGESTKTVSLGIKADTEVEPTENLVAYISVANSSKSGFYGETFTPLGNTQAVVSLLNAAPNTTPPPGPSPEPGPNPAPGQVINATPAGGRIVGTASNDTINGNVGNDFVVGGLGDDGINGGAGMDTSAYAGVRRQYTTSPNSVRGPEGNDTLTSIERIEFTDGDLFMDTGSTAAKVFRIYGTTLGREPETEGLRFWTGALENGTSLTQIASGFTSSIEFQSRYGNADNAGFVNLLYQNVLGRGPDATGAQHWNSVLDTGGQTRSEVVVQFSESAENIIRTSPSITKGLWVGDTNAAIVARVYDTTLDRQPDAVGLKTWTDSLNGGTAVQTVISKFMESPEFVGKYGTLDDAGFVNQLYLNVLDRGAEPAGLAGWTGALANGVSREDVVLGFSESPEHIAKLAPVINDGIWTI